MEYEKFMNEMMAKTGIRITNSPVDALKAGMSPRMILTSRAAYGNPKQFDDDMDYSKMPETVFMCPSSMKDSATFKASMLHELAHATGQAERCSRLALTAKRAPTDIERACEEIIADSVSTNMMELLGWHTEESRALSRKYIDDWTMMLMAQGVYSRELMDDLAKEVRKSIDFMMTNWFPEHNADKKQEAA